jgi:hypothetical protein
VAAQAWSRHVRRLQRVLVAGSRAEDIARCATSCDCDDEAVAQSPIHSVSEWIRASDRTSTRAVCPACALRTRAITGRGKTPQGVFGGASRAPDVASSAISGACDNETVALSPLHSASE